MHTLILLKKSVGLQISQVGLWLYPRNLRLSNSLPRSFPEYFSETPHQFETHFYAVYDGQTCVECPYNGVPFVCRRTQRNYQLLAQTAYLLLMLPDLCQQFRFLSGDVFQREGRMFGKVIHAACH